MIVRALASSLLLTGCVAILDLDAEPGSEGGAGGAGTTQTSAATTIGPTTGDAGAATSADASSSSGGPTCVDEAALFSGMQFIRADNPTHNALDFDDKVALGAWVRPDPSFPLAAGYEGFVFSRLSDSAKKGYALVVRRSQSDGLLYPEFRFYAAGDLFTCKGQSPIDPGVWSHVGALFAQGHVQGGDAGLWVNGQSGCVIDCGGAKLSKYPATPTIGAALNGTAGFFVGALDDVFVQTAASGPPPALESGGCAQGVVFLVSFDGPAAQSFTPSCSAPGITLTLGADASPAGDDPSLGCP